MRSVYVLGLTLIIAASPAVACEDFETIQFPGIAKYGIVRGDHLLAVNDSNRLIAVDLKRGKTHDLGTAEHKRWYDGDVANGHAMVLTADRMHVINLETGKTVKEIPLDYTKVTAFGFAGKDRAFIHRGSTLDILEISSGKTLHTIVLLDNADHPNFTPWQKVGSRLFVVGPANTLCIIDLEAGKLLDRLPVDSRGGIASLHVEGSRVYLAGSPRSWGVRFNQVVCIDIEMKKSRTLDLSLQSARFASGSYGTFYVISGSSIDRFTPSGERCATTPINPRQPVLAMWRQQAIVVVKNELRIVDLVETAIARK